MIPTQPIGRGGRRLAVLRASGFTVDETWYPRDLELVPHSHEHANLCLVLQGALTERAGRHERVCEAGTLIVKPQGEVHSDRFHSDARCLSITIDPERLGLLRQVLPTLAESQFEVDPILLTLGHRMCSELHTVDDLSPLAVESLALELIAARIRAARRRSARSADWTEKARDYLHDHFTRAPGLASVAAAVGRHPAHVAQHFRLRYGVSVGEYVRRLRVARVAHLLLTTEKPLAELAAEVGFTDQSHMQRLFKARIGVTPGAYRRAHG